jgi:mannosyltransferase OCH1-like enzyme
MRSIPYIIHQIWFQGWNEVPDKYKENVKLLHKYNPKYKQLQWDEHSLRVECAKFSKEVLDKFNSFPYLIQKVDLSRFVVLYNYGGVSIDTDMKSLKPIDTTPNIESADCIVSMGSFPLNVLGYTNNAVFLIKPRHPLMYDIINSIVESNKKESSYFSKELYIDATTGPRFVDSIVKRHDVIKIDNIYYEPCNEYFPCSIDAESIMDHQHGNSWMDSSSIIIIKILIFLLMALFTACIIYFVVFVYSKIRGVSYKNFKVAFIR